MAVYLGNSQVGFNYVPSVAGTTNIEVLPLEITSNGTYTAIAGSAYSPIEANVKPTLKVGVIRSDAECIQRYTYNSLLVEDEEITLPAYSTSTTSLKASQDLTPTITLSYDTYDYYILEKFLTIPKYNITTKGKGRQEYTISFHIYEITELPPNAFIALLDGTSKYTSRNVPIPTTGVTRELYWSSASALGLYTSASYGVSQSVVAPAISSGVLTVKSPSISIRGNGTYLSSTYFNAITDINAQYVIEIYRAKKDYLNLDGWGIRQGIMDIIDNINNNNATLK